MYIFCRVSYRNISQICALLQDEAVLALRGNNIITHVATFGDTNVTTTGDWVQILEDVVPIVGPHLRHACYIAKPN